jgi:NADH:ubiquinone oxidoreductase subunit 2 (subunit N)
MSAFFVELFSSHSSRNLVSLLSFSTSTTAPVSDSSLFVAFSNRDGSLFEGRGFLSFFPPRILLVTLLLLPVFFSSARTSVALRAFLHRLTGGLLILHLVRFLSGTVFRFGSSTSSLLVGALDDLGLLPRLFLFLATFLLALFFFVTAERSLIAFRVGEREFPVLLILLHLGGAFALYLSTTRELFLALERVTLASYVLIAFERQNRFSTFAGLHYFLLGAVPSGILLLAFAFFYLFGGSLVLQERDLLFVPAAAVAFPASVYGTSFSPFSASASPFASESDSLTQAIEAAVSVSATGSFFEDLISVTNPLTGLTSRAVVFLIVNFFFKLTAAPVHF